MDFFFNNAVTNSQVYKIWSIKGIFPVYVGEGSFNETPTAEPNVTSGQVIYLFS
jgi:hypothetical protein